MYRVKIVALSALSALAACGNQAEPKSDPAGPSEGAVSTAPPKAAQKKGRKPREYEYDTVATNPDLDIPAGFRGDVHPELAPDAQLELLARWKPTLPEAKRKGLKLGIIDNAQSSEYAIPDELIALLTESKPAAERVTYGARELSALLPATLESVGQMWKIDPEGAAHFLKQLHPGTSMTFDHYRQPYGRRPGPAGAFGIVRALTPAYLDVLFRVHAEFDLKPGAALYTPACFLGRLVLDRERDAVAYLDLRVPLDLSVNLNILLTFPLPDDSGKEVTNIVFERIETMDLSGGDAAVLARTDGPDALLVAEAHARVKRAFYKFLDVEWVALEQAVATATALGKPILAAVLTSPLDDQSC